MYGNFLQLKCTSAMVLILATLSAPGAQAQPFTIMLASRPPADGRYSTAGDILSLTVSSGERVTLANERGRDYALRSASGFFWAQVEQVPRDADAVSILPTLREDGSLDVQVEQINKTGDRQTRFASTVLIEPGQWIRLYGPPVAASLGTRVYSTRTERPEDSLYMYLEVQ